ncbi:MAG: C-GCAxxG-C-C family protein [Ruminococcus sp.]|nr:C-GCAxxG-C-C family protein [Ruminococcus sp.]
MSRAENAKANFFNGYNCSQAVVVAFADLLEIDEITAKKMSMGLGGGMGRLREVCGAVSGAAMVLGALYGGEDASDKASAYAKIQQFAEKFKEKNGTIICRELLGLDKNIKQSPIPEERSKEYYEKRPCPQKVYEAAQILEEMIDNNC